MLYRGTVQKGEGRAAVLGFPTINIPLSDPSISGVYGAIVEFDGKKYVAAAFADPGRGTLEAHLIGASVALYGMEVEIQLVEKLRESRKFADDEALREAITDDVKKLRERFGL